MSGFPNQFPSGATPESINSLPNYTITPETNAATTTCTVCMDPFIANTEAKILPCKHFYHSHCILPWLNMKNSCPVCRFELPSVEEPYYWSMNMMDEGRLNWGWFRNNRYWLSSDSRITNHNFPMDWWSGVRNIPTQNNVIEESLVEDVD